MLVFLENLKGKVSHEIHLKPYTDNDCTLLFPSNTRTLFDVQAPNHLFKYKNHIIAELERLNGEPYFLRRTNSYQWHVSKILAH